MISIELRCCRRGGSRPRKNLQLFIRKYTLHVNEFNNVCRLSSAGDVRVGVIIGYASQRFINPNQLVNFHAILTQTACILTPFAIITQTSLFTRKIRIRPHSKLPGSSP